jgi:hypothetical protein
MALETLHGKKWDRSPRENRRKKETLRLYSVLRAKAAAETESELKPLAAASVTPGRAISCVRQREVVQKRVPSRDGQKPTKKGDPASL